MNIHLTIFIVFVFSRDLLIYALEHCDDQHGGYCIEDGSRGCCVHGPPLCCKDGHGDCIPRLGFNYNNTKCEKLECLEGEVCMPLGGEGKDKCVPKNVEVCNNYLIFERTAKCGDNGYPIGYGLKYCNKFYQFYDSFNDFGKNFVKCVGPCLAEKMSENIEDVQVCNDYLKFEDKAKCGNNGYLIGYGLKYCNKFYQNYDSFNDHGKEFIKCVGPCLAEKMRINIEKYKENCDLLRNFAFDSHTPCYLKCNFTKFNVWFKNADVFVKVIDLKDLFSSETFRQMKNIILGEIMDEKTFEECAFYYNSLEETKKDLNLAERCSHVLEKKFNQITV
uniref:Uncharacterized protein n=1 Tax=Meloidogyne incognita TaxID=6306 RepID=A0A914KXZ3_MELIC